MMGRYELIRALKGGGMAEVFLGRRRGPGGVEKQLVVKRIRREYARDPRFIRLFLSEARLSMTLSHRNIVPVFDFGRADDELFFVMEFVDGVDLARALKCGETEPVEPILAAFIAMEVCQALDYAHSVRKQRGSAGVIHRDVTPRNVLLSYAGEVKLADFGVATLTDTESTSRGVRGTPAYMAPEQARDLELDGRADLFSLGLVLWEMLSGTRAYPGSDARKLLALAKAAEVPALPDSVPAELRAVVDRATAADPAERFVDANEMQRALDRFVVARRASDGDVAPPNQLLSAWLKELYPHPQKKAVGKATGKMSRVTSVGSVVTFLDHGEEAIAQIVDDDGTMRSMAETAVGDSEIDAESAGDGGVADEAVDMPSAPSVTTERTRGRGPVFMLVAAAAAAIVVAGVWITTDRASFEPVVAQQPDARPPPVVAVAATVDAGVAIAEPPADATVAVVAPPTDANTPPIKRTPPVKIKHVVRGKADAAIKRALGTLQISTSPWAKVQVVGTGHRCADTPCTLQLPAGTYKVTLTNPVANVGKTVSVTIAPGKTFRVRETLTRAQ